MLAASIRLSDVIGVSASASATPVAAATMLPSARAMAAVAPGKPKS